jgi:hypothetical protein
MNPVTAGLLIGLALSPATVLSQANLAKPGPIRVSGSVVDESGAILPADVALQPVNSGKTATPAKTDMNGRFSFATVSPGIYELIIVRAGFRKFTQPIYVNGTDDIEVGTLAMTFRPSCDSVPDPDYVPAEFPADLLSGSLVDGIGNWATYLNYGLNYGLTYAPIPQIPPIVVSGRVVDETGRPIARAVVVLMGCNSQQRATTDGNGVFSTPVPPDIYLLEVWALGFNTIITFGDTSPEGTKVVVMKPFGAQR